MPDIILYGASISCPFTFPEENKSTNMEKNIPGFNEYKISLISKKELFKNKIYIITKDEAESIQKSSEKNLLEHDYDVMIIGQNEEGEFKFRAKPEVSDRIADLMKNKENFIMSYRDEHGTIKEIKLDRDRIVLDPLSNKEYERLYRNTYSAFQNLADFYKKANEQAKANAKQVQHLYPLKNRVYHGETSQNKKKPESKEKVNNTLNERKIAEEAENVGKSKAQRKKRMKEEILKTYEKVHEVIKNQRNRDEFIEFNNHDKKIIVKSHKNTTRKTG